LEGGRRGRGGGAGGGCEEECFFVAKVDAVGTAKFIKVL
jgi:hypothetical protein